VTRCWIAILDQRSGEADAAAEVHDAEGEPRGFMAAWIRRSKPVRHALRVDARIVDATGEAAWISLVEAPKGVRLAFDDPAVQQARRDVLARPPTDAVSTLLRDDSHFEGAITVARGPDAKRQLRDDPFARVLPARLLRVGPGLLGATQPPVGPTIERYGSANPWPWDRFE
jgi:hypothetical protein